MSRAPELGRYPVGAWVVAEPGHRRFLVLALWSGVRWYPLGPSGFMGQRWMKARRALATTREPLRALHLASRGVLAAYGVPLGRPVSRRVFDRASGTVFWLPLRN